MVDLSTRSHKFNGKKERYLLRELLDDPMTTSPLQKKEK
jgi:hypothetical protein